MTKSARIPHSSRPFIRAHCCQRSFHICAKKLHRAVSDLSSVPEARLIPSPWLALRINSDSCHERSLRTRADIVQANHRRVRKYVEEFCGAEMDATHLQHSAGSN